MSLIQAARPASGSGPAEEFAWQLDEFPITDPWDAGDLDLTLSQAPAFPSGIFINSQGQPLFPADYTFSAPNTITIDFPGDPAVYDGTWTFVIQYQYET